MMRFKINIELEMDAFNQDSAERRVQDLLSKVELKKFKERNTVVTNVEYTRIDKQEKQEDEEQ